MGAIKKPYTINIFYLLDSQKCTAKGFKKYKVFNVVPLEIITLKTAQFTSNAYHDFLQLVYRTRSHVEIEVQNGGRFNKYYTCIRFHGFKRIEPLRELAENENRKQTQR